MASKLPEYLSEIKDNVFIEREAPAHTAGITDIDAFMSLGVDNAWSMERFEKEFSMEITEIDE